MTYEELKQGLEAGTITDVPLTWQPSWKRDEYAALSPAKRVEKWLSTDHALYAPSSISEIGF